VGFNADPGVRRPSPVWGTGVGEAREKIALIGGRQSERGVSGPAMVSPGFTSIAHLVPRTEATTWGVRI
jgi:hypothetical protein